MIGEGRRGYRRREEEREMEEEEARKWGERGEGTECLLTHVQTKLYVLLQQSQLHVQCTCC